MVHDTIFELTKPLTVRTPIKAGLNKYKKARLAADDAPSDFALPAAPAATSPPAAVPAPPAADSPGSAPETTDDDMLS